MGATKATGHHAVSDPPPPRYVTCPCQHCDGGIEFDANELAEENSIVPCPHCGQDTELHIPSADEVASVAPAQDISTPRRHKRVRFAKGTRVALTPAQCATPTGQELIGLLVEIERDGLVTENAVRRLNEWLNSKADSEIRGVLFLLDFSRDVLSRGKLTMDDAFEMHWAIERVLPKHIQEPLVKKRCEIENQLPASEETLAHIRQLGGNPPPGMTRAEAFELEGRLSDQATEKQVAYIRRLGGNPPPGITFDEASSLIDELLHSVKATEKQLQFIRDLGGNPPAGLSRAGAEELIPQLQAKQYESSAKQQPPTPRQMMVLRFWNMLDLVQLSKWHVEKWQRQFYDEDPRRKAAWESFKAEKGDDGSQRDPSWVPLGAGESYLSKLD